MSTLGFNNQVMFCLDLISGLQLTSNIIYIYFSVTE